MRLTTLAVLLAASLGGTSARAQFYDLYDFGGYAADGANPNGDLVQWVDGSFWGTTSSGGLGNNNNCGTIFRISIGAGETLNTSFSCPTNSMVEPMGGLAVGSDGNLYGTTWYGGVTGCEGSCSTVFRVSPTTGFFTTIAQPIIKEGWKPVGILIPAPSGLLYGVTEQGGAITASCASPPYTLGCGTVFTVALDGTYKKIANLNSGPLSPGFPLDSLVLGKDGKFYGTSSQGGTGSCSAGTSTNCGTIFQVTPSGQVMIVANMYAPTGSSPASAMAVASDGTLYGTTEYGGSNNVGVLFSVNSQLAYQAFSLPLSASVSPRGRLLLANDGNLYGATPGGGHRPGGNTATVFRFSPSTGAFATIYTFPFPPGGANSDANGGLIQGIDGNLYGTALGTGVNYKGSVFQLQLGLKPLLPEVASFSPTSGPVGTTVTVKGKNLITVENVTFGGGVTAPATMLTPNQLTVVVPAGATTGPLQVTTSVGSGKSSKSTFTVN